MFFKKVPIQWLIVFLGNPGAKYAGTRHNVGFAVADEAEKSLGIRINRLKFSALTASAEISGQKAFLLKPQTYMNLSGTAVRQAMNYYRIPVDHILVISDDVALPVARIRIKRGGSHGGHNGLKDIIAKCGGDGFPRIKIGVGAPDTPEYDMADWVLGTFRGRDAEEIADAAQRAFAAVCDIMANGIDHAMNQYNG